MHLNLRTLSKAMGGLVFAMSMGVLIGIGACSGSGSNSSSGGTTGSANPACVDNSFLQILYDPMYSAVDDGGDLYQIPAVVNGVDQSQIAWSASPASAVALALDSSTGGTMITTLQPGVVTITAQLSGTTYCGTATLTIDGASAQDWAAGEARYNSGTVITHVGQGTQSIDGGVACTSCHGATATMAQFKDISHTPEQTGGFSDQDMINIINNGVVPDGGYFDTSIISYEEWHHLHQWDVDPNTVQDLVYYLRSLPPSAQDGSSAFGGNFCPPDAGPMGCQPPKFPDGGRQYGPPPLPDGGHGHGPNP